MRSRCSSRITSIVFFESNVWHVRGRDRDLVVDAGNGIGDLRAELDPLVEGRPVVAVATHDHFDHIGGMHAFEERWCHAADADGLREPDGLALLRRDYPAGSRGRDPLVRLRAARGGRSRRSRARGSTWRAGGRPRRSPRASSRTAMSWTSAIVPSRSSTSRGTPRGRSPSGTPPPVCCSRATPRRSTTPSTPRTRMRSSPRSAGSVRLPVDLVCAGHSRPFGREELRALIDEQLEARSHG